jgi:hypothetical protein
VDVSGWTINSNISAVGRHDPHLNIYSNTYSQQIITEPMCYNGCIESSKKEAVAMMRYKTFKFQIYPNKAQGVLIKKTFGCFENVGFPS